MYCTTKQFPELKFLGPYTKPHGLRGLGNHYHMRFVTKLGHGTYEIRCMPCYCSFSAYIIDQPWIPGFLSQQQQRYQPIKYFTYWPILGSFKNWRIIKSSHKATSSEEIDKIH